MTKIKTTGKVNIKDINLLIPELGKGPEENFPEDGAITQGEGQEVKSFLLESVKSFTSRAFEELKNILYRRFTPDQIKQRTGKGGRSFDYIAACSVIDRLNEAFKFKWSLTVTEMNVSGDEIDCLVTLTALIDGEWISKQQYGTQEREQKKAGGNVNPLGDDKKSAVSDGLKKCATLFGIGHFLYKK